MDVEVALSVSPQLWQAGKPFGTEPVYTKSELALHTVTDGLTALLHMGTTASEGSEGRLPSWLRRHAGHGLRGGPRTAADHNGSF